MTDTMRNRIDEHASHLAAIFPDAKKTGYSLCSSLRRMETKAHRLAEAMCNGYQSEADQLEAEAETDRIVNRANALLGTSRVWFNGDPRGYALKINMNPAETLHRDWGGSGIIAPDLTSD